MVQKRTFGNYLVITKKDQNMDRGVLEIYRGKKLIYSEKEYGHYFYFGNHFDEKLSQVDPYSGNDINLNGIKDLVISHWTGGAHCCHYVYVFEMGKDLKKIADISAGSSGVELIDLNKDGKLEIKFWDWPIDYAFSSYAQSAQGETILEFKEGMYQLAPIYMVKPMLSDEELKISKKLILSKFDEKSPDLPYEFQKLMMDLSYSGNINEAMSLAQELWPKGRLGFEEFKIKFRKYLNESKYWREFMVLKDRENKNR